MSQEENKNVENAEEPKFENKVEGKKALDGLFDALDDEGLLVDPEQEVQNLLDRVSNLEKEVDVLKDLLARALNVNDGKVLKG